MFRKRSFSTCCATFRHFFYLLFRMAWVRIWMLFECFGSASPRALEAGDSSFLVRSVGDVFGSFSSCCVARPGHVQFGHQSCCCSAVSEAFLQVIPVSHGLGLNPSSFFTRSLGNVRQFSGSCFVQFGHQSCCCSAVSEAFLQVIPFIDFPLAFRSCFAWFGPQSF